MAPIQQMQRDLQLGSIQNPGWKKIQEIAVGLAVCESPFKGLETTVEEISQALTFGVLCI